MALSSLPKVKRGSTDVRERQSASTSSPSLDVRLNALYASLSTSSDLNPLIDLTTLLREHILDKKDSRHAIALRKGVHFLVRSIQTLLRENRIPVHNASDEGLLIISTTTPNDGGQSDAQSAVTQWLQSRWNECVLLLCQLLSCHDEETQIIALDSLMELQRDASAVLTKSASTSAVPATKANVRAQWSRTPWQALVSSLLGHSTPDGTNSILSTFVEKYLQEYDDVRFAFCRDVEHALRPRRRQQVTSDARSNALRLLLGVTAIPTKPQHLNTFLVKELEANERMTRKKKSGRNTDVKENRSEELDEEIEDWFSDSDDEESSEKRQNAAGLGKAAVAAADAQVSQRRLKRNPAFCDAVFSLAVQRSAFSRAWLAVLLPHRDPSSNDIVGGSLSEAMTHESLIRMHTQIIPHLSKPNMLHDFLVDALDSGGATALLALNTLFTLMTKHNLNYPAFYTRLYGLLQADPPVLHVRYRSRFLRMLDVFLSSTHLPAALIASFAKRLSRIALRAPPSAIVTVIPFVWNLCKRHKHCLGLLHREFGNDRFDVGPIGLVDPYDPVETDPLKTNAIESSLWELASLGSLIGAAQQHDIDHAGQAHYLSSVAMLSRILAEPFTKERYGLEDFLDLTYGTMFDTEVGKTLKRREGKKVIEPAIRFALPGSENGKRPSTFGTEEGDGKQVMSDKRIKLVEGEEDDETVPLEADQENVEERQAFEESRRSEHVDLCSRLFQF